MKFPSQTPHTEFPESHPVHFSAHSVTIFLGGPVRQSQRAGRGPDTDLPTLKFHWMVCLHPLFFHCLQSRHVMFVNGRHHLLQPL